MKIYLRTNKVILIILLIVILSSIGYDQYQTYTSDIGTDYFLNPIYTEGHPDSSIFRDNHTYYVVQLSFEYYYLMVTVGGAAELSAS
jgi:beta-xylosidase